MFLIICKIIIIKLDNKWKKCVKYVMIKLIKKSKFFMALEQNIKMGGWGRRINTLLQIGINTKGIDCMTMGKYTG